MCRHLLAELYNLFSLTIGTLGCYGTRVDDWSGHHIRIGSWVGRGIRSHGQVDYLIQIWDLMNCNFVVEGHVTGIRVNDLEVDQQEILTVRIFCSLWEWLYGTIQVMGYNSRSLPACVQEGDSSRVSVIYSNSLRVIPFHLGCKSVLLPSGPLPTASFSRLLRPQCITGPGISPFFNQFHRFRPRVDPAMYGLCYARPGWPLVKCFEIVLFFGIFCKLLFLNFEVISDIFVVDASHSQVSSTSASSSRRRRQRRGKLWNEVFEAASTLFLFGLAAVLILLRAHETVLDLSLFRLVLLPRAESSGNTGYEVLLNEGVSLLQVLESSLEKEHQTVLPLILCRISIRLGRNSELQRTKGSSIMLFSALSDPDAEANFESNKATNRVFEAAVNGVLIVVTFNYLHVVVRGNEEVCLSNDITSRANGSDLVILTSSYSDAESSDTSNLLHNHYVYAVTNGWSISEEVSVRMDGERSLQATVRWNALDSAIPGEGVESAQVHELRDMAAFNQVLDATNLAEMRSPSTNFLAGFGNRGTNDVPSVDVESPAVRPGSPAREGALHE